MITNKKLKTYLIILFLIFILLFFIVFLLFVGERRRLDRAFATLSRLLPSRASSFAIALITCFVVIIIIIIR